MKPLILKFGGTSLSESDKILYIARKISKLKKDNPNIICVLSAPSNLTDDLINLTSKFKENKREKDALLSCGEQISITLMAMALNKIGLKAISLNAYQAGILTDENHSNAKIIKIKNLKRIKKELEKGNIVLIAGFQGINKYNDYTTLGRSGSDLTAICLAKFIGAKCCHIYSDVSGVFTVNPFLVPCAKKMPIISYREVLELAKSGTEVRQLKAIEFAMKNKIEIYLASSFSDEKGTLISEKGDSKKGVHCISLKDNEIYLIGKLTNLKENILEFANKNNLKLENFSDLKAKLSFQNNQNHKTSELLISLHKTFIQ